MWFLSWASSDGNRPTTDFQVHLELRSRISPTNILPVTFYQSEFRRLVLHTPQTNLYNKEFGAQVFSMLRFYFAFCEFVIQPQNKVLINTAPRGPVAAMFHSPGPVYLLPTLVGQKFHDPRSVHPRGPAYPFGIRHKQFREDIGPGPCHFPHPKMLRDGREGIPRFTMLARHPDIEQFQSPGPAAYKPTMTAAVERPPEFTFGMKYLDFKKDNMPGRELVLIPFIVKFYEQIFSS